MRRLLCKNGRGIHYDDYPAPKELSYQTPFDGPAPSRIPSAYHLVYQSADQLPGSAAAGRGILQGIRGAVLRVLGNTDQRSASACASDQHQEGDLPGVCVFQQLVFT